MLKYIIIAASILIIILIIVLIFSSSKKKILLSMLNIDEATSNIGVLLKRKLELLKTLEEIAKNKIDIADLNINFEELEKKNLNSFELNTTLRNIHNDLFKAIDISGKFKKNKKAIDTLEDLNDNEEDLFGVIHFYNDSVVTYNGLLSSFPTSIVAKLTKYKKLDFFTDEKREIFEILKK